MKFTARYLVTAENQKRSFRGLPFVIQDPKGTVREGVDPEGHAWSCEMKCDYGYIPGTTAAGDEENLDVYIGDDENAEFVYVVEQVFENGDFDEYKVMLGFPSLQAAEEMYQAHGPDKWDGAGDVYEVPLEYLFDAVKEHQKQAHKHKFDETHTCEDCGAKQCTVIEDLKRCANPATKNGYCRKHQDRVPWLTKFPRKFPHKFPRKASAAGLIQKFVAQYARQRRLYSKAADVVRGEIAAACAARNIRAAITARAKTVDSLEKKLLQRDPVKSYQGVGDILNDIKDMAGVRVALYFPIDREVIGQIIRELYDEAKPPKHFPEDREPDEPEGYEATHYAVKYAGLVVEIQVATALMICWAEVGHDLLYKPRHGRLTPTELQLLDELKATVSDGEQTVVELQKLLRSRTSSFKSSELRQFVAQFCASLDRCLSQMK